MAERIKVERVASPDLLATKIPKVLEDEFKAAIRALVALLRPAGERVARRRPTLP
jgi:hypothetical protein